MHWKVINCNFPTGNAKAAGSRHLPSHSSGPDPYLSPWPLLQTYISSSWPDTITGVSHGQYTHNVFNAKALIISPCLLTLSPGFPRSELEHLPSYPSQDISTTLDYFFLLTRSCRNLMVFQMILSSSAPISLLISPCPLLDVGHLHLLPGQ